MPQANAHIGANQVIGFNKLDGRPKGGRCEGLDWLRLWLLIG